MTLRNFYFVILLITFCNLCIYTKVEYTNIKCKSLDPAYTAVGYCFIKSINRTYSYFSLRVNMLQLPIDNITINISLLKRANGYKPFLYNITFDSCRFLRIRKNIVIKYFAGFFLEHSNLDHACPFNHDVIMDKLPASKFDELLSKKLPMPRGEFVIKTVWSAYNVPRVTFDIYFRLL